MEAPQIHNQHNGRHIVKDIHRMITVMQIIGILFLLVVIFPVTGIVNSSFFKFGPPFVVLDIRITSVPTFLLLTAWVIIDRIFAVFSYECFRRMSRVYGDDKIKMFIVKTVDYSVNGIRTIFTYILLYSQFSFLIISAVPDIVTTYYMSKYIITRRRSLEEYYDLVLYFSVLSIIIFLAFMNALGYVDSFYFHIGAPVLPFGILLSSDFQFSVAVFFVFVDAMLYDYLSSKFEYFKQHVLCNTIAKERSDLVFENNATIYFIVATATSYQWIRNVFVLNFLFSQFTFTFIYLAAKLVSYGFQQYETDEIKSIRVIPQLLLLFTAELVGVVIVVNSLNPWGLPFFQWPPPLPFFDVEIHKALHINLVLVYVVYKQMCVSLYNNITKNDIDNSYHYGYYLLNASSEEVTFFEVCNRLHYWINDMVLVQFAIRNISFVVVSAIGDIFVIVIVTAKSLRFSDILISANARFKKYKSQTHDPRNKERLRREQQEEKRALIRKQTEQT
jgi:hypothetical protein